MCAFEESSRRTAHVTGMLVAYVLCAFEIRFCPELLLAMSEVTQLSFVTVASDKEVCDNFTQ